MSVTEKNMGGRGSVIRMLLVAPALLIGGGCVTINAPDKPIVINLNIAITQEVVYRLDSKARSVIEDNPGIF